VLTARPAWLPLARAQIRQSAGPLTVLADHLAAPGPVPAQGVAMVSRLLADGTGSLYRQSSTQDLGDLIATATRALTRQTSGLPGQRPTGVGVTAGGGVPSRATPSGQPQPWPS
jgi:hypothetical protein